MQRKFIGGQAVIEGVLMVFEDAYSIAVQTPEGIHVETKRSAVLNSRLLRIPLIRGIIALLAMAAIGLKAMMTSSQYSSDEGEELSTGLLILTLVLTLLFVLIIFKLVPLIVAGLIVDSSHPVLFNLLDGILRIGILVGYIALISRLPDIKRLFGYHGAEHKVINAHEHGSLTLANAKRQSRFNSRCGTTFVVLVLLVAMLVYSLTPLDYPLMQLLLIRVLLLVPIASISYELIRFAATRTKNPLVSLMLWPGYMVQRLTVREPDEQQLRVALAAAKALLEK